MAISQERLSKAVSHALRHEPWLYELDLDEAGWVPIAELLDALQTRGGEWVHLARDDLVDMIDSSTKRRHEIDGDRIRALYGHSVPGRLVKEEAEPPEILFHGTSPPAWDVIRHQGLMPMGRQYVHLSVDTETALQVGGRKARRPVVIRVQAREASRQGVHFYRGNEMVWLAHGVPAQFLAVGRQ